MVSKVAIIAIVGIIAVPILLGYALNLNEVTETEYRPNGEAVNVTQMLINGSDFTTAHADLYQLNAEFPRNNVMYKSVGTTKTSLYVNNDHQTGYVDFAGGFQFYARSPSTNYNGAFDVPENPISVLFTVNLDELIDDNYIFAIFTGSLGSEIVMEKQTVAGEVLWTVSDDIISPTVEYQLYYDPTIQDNTYQIQINYSDIINDPLHTGKYAYTVDYNLRYVGSWPTLIGEANFYLDYTISKSIDQFPNSVIDTVTIENWSGVDMADSPLLRVDDAIFKAMEFPVIEDRRYTPASFKSNPATTISDPVKYGTSFDFGGNTYTVSKGNITLGTHQIPVKGLVLSSVPNGNGEYDNKIGDTVISTTAAPSAITFNGKWSASISTIGQEQYQYTKTEWIAGGFAWDGMDQSFLMVGLITSLGMFIALGIYARRSRASVWPLMLVCGGAAALFFIML